MALKKIIRAWGYDIVYYRPFYTSVLTRQKIETVLDIGANNGQFALDIHERLPKAKIYSFEPLKNVFNELQDKLKKIPTSTGFNIALGDTNGEAHIYSNDFSPSSSLLPMEELHKQLYPKTAQTHPETTTIKRLDDMRNELHITGNLLVKIDVQGFEDKVLEGGQKTISEATMLLIETSFVRLYKNQPLFDDIYSKVHALGFSYYGHREQHFNQTTHELLFEDSIFIKNFIKN